MISDDDVKARNNIRQLRNKRTMGGCVLVSRGFL